MNVIYRNEGSSEWVGEIVSYGIKGLRRDKKNWDIIHCMHYFSKNPNLSTDGRDEHNAIVFHPSYFFIWRN